MTDEFLNLAGVSKSFAGVHALQDADLTIEQGRIHCLVGENGSGKSTLIKVIAGVYERDTGSIVINGKEFERLLPIDAIREATRRFLTTGEASDFQGIGRRLLGGFVTDVRQVHLGGESSTGGGPVS